MNRTDAQTALAFLAMLIIGALTGALVFHAVPAENKELVTFTLGALSGALTIGGGAKLADKITNPIVNTDSQVQPDPSQGQTK